MEALNSPSKVTSRIWKTEPINWRELNFIQQENFKELDELSRHKLKASIVANNFTQPFYVWQDLNSKLWCLDGKHRTLLLQELIQEGAEVPYLLPATFIHCDNRQEAAKLVLLFSSQYARVTQDGLQDFLSLNDLDLDDLKEQIDLPDFSMLRFEQNFGNSDITDADEEPVDVEGQDIVIRTGDFFRLGDHVIYCGNYTDQIVTDFLENNLMKARIVLTDPPYNLAAREFTNKGAAQHEDFAMAAGEMTDEQFVVFLQEIMQRSSVHSVDGAIHYIFMDWRHMWHMTEAGRRVYGTVTPKQLAVWNKTNGANGSFYRSKHELVFIYKHGDAKHVSNIDLKDRTRYNVWDYPNSTAFNNSEKSELLNHPTPKNLAMISDAILDSTHEGELVIDWFLGSGTTLIGAEITGRKAFGTDIEPAFIQSTILRYIKRCRREGKQATITHLNGPLTLESFELLLPES